mmetsp:Transcript_4857/g.16214  ORF Transcript_4857/g.16214 Transcript_4857/m.16214 type:complete len:279 (-) Transcript_4857:230-1066(-)
MIVSCALKSRFFLSKYGSSSSHARAYDATRVAINAAINGPATGTKVTTAPIGIVAAVSVANACVRDAAAPIPRNPKPFADSNADTARSFSLIVSVAVSCTFLASSTLSTSSSSLVSPTFPPVTPPPKLGSTAARAPSKKIFSPSNGSACCTTAKDTNGARSKHAPSVVSIASSLTSFAMPFASSAGDNARAMRKKPPTSSASAPPNTAPVNGFQACEGDASAVRAPETAHCRPTPIASGKGRGRRTVLGYESSVPRNTRREEEPAPRCPRWRRGDTSA